MTFPTHCPHSESSWCLECVQWLWEHLADIERVARRLDIWIIQSIAEAGLEDR